jgi:hypothetical protein
VSSLPERINVMRVVTYNVEAICEDIRECHRWNHGVELEGDIPISEVLLWIEDWVAEDFGTTDGLTYQDENGEEL